MTNKSPIFKKATYSKAKNYITDNPWLVLVLSAAVLASLFIEVKAALIVLALVALTAVTKLLQIAVPFVISLDTALFMIVMLAMAYGAFPAIMLTLVAYYVGTIVKSMLSGKGEAASYVVPPAGLVLSGIMAAALPFGIVVTGMATVIFYAVLMLSFYWIMYRDVANEITFFLTIIPFNYWLLSQFGEKVLAALA